MSAVSTQPRNYNSLSGINFKFSLKRAPHVNFFVTQANTPAITLGAAPLPTPFRDTTIPGDKIEYGTLDVTFHIDEDMNNYLEIYNWMIALGFPNDFNQYKTLQDQAKNTPMLGNGLVSDATLTVLSSAKNKNINIKFQNIFPIQLTDVVFNLENTDVDYIQATVSFNFQNFTIEQI